MDKHRNIEDQMKSVADQQRTTPPAFVWDNVTAELDKDKGKKRGFVFWIWGVGLLGLSMAGYFFVADGNHGSMSTKHSAVVVALEKNTATKASTDIGSSDLQGLSAHSLEEASEIGESSKAVQDEVANITVSVKMSKETDTDEFQSDGISSPEAVNKKKATISGDYKSESQAVVESSVPYSANDKKANRVVQSLSTQVNVSQRSSSTDVVTANTVRAFDVVADLDSRSQELKEAERKINGLKKVECPQFAVSKNIPLPFVELSGILGTHSKSLAQGSASRALLENRNATESSWLDYGAQITVGWYLNSDFYIGSGLEATRATDRFEKSREGLTKMIIDFDLNTGEAVDTSFVTGNIMNQGLIRYQMIDIPVVLGYRRLVDRWSFGVEAAALINLRFSAKGKIMSEDRSVSTIADEGSVYKENVGLGLKSSFVVGSYLSHGLSIQSRLTYKSYLQDVNRTSYAMPTSLDFWRVEVGVRKEF